MYKYIICMYIFHFLSLFVLCVNWFGFGLTFQFHCLDMGFIVQKNLVREVLLFVLLVRMILYLRILLVWRASFLSSSSTLFFHGLVSVSLPVSRIRFNTFLPLPSVSTRNKGVVDISWKQYISQGVFSRSILIL